ncbi:hypothetical protein JT358_10060 [Micrococcales bacterium 31B]|nr:hypothetical protein [Micrococcales bacterium 31B]
MRIKSLCTGMVLATAIVVGSASASHAWVALGTTTAHPSIGGVWHYGFGGVSIFSDYTAPFCHTSTVWERNNGWIVNSATSGPTAAHHKAAAGIRLWNGPDTEASYFYAKC